MRNANAKAGMGRNILLAVVICLIALGAGSTFYAWFIYKTPNVFPQWSYSEIMTVKYPTNSTTVTASNGINYTIPTPTVHFSITTTFTAQGGYGADNPITIHSVINGANASLMDYYCCLFFTDASSPSPSEYEAGWLNLADLHNGTYVANGTLEWAAGGPTYTWLYPNNPLPSGRALWGVAMNVIAPNGSGRQPTLTIDPLSSTQSWQNNELQVREGYTTVGWVPFGLFVSFVSVTTYLSKRKEPTASEGQSTRLNSTEATELRTTIYQPLFAWASGWLDNLPDGPEELHYQANPPPRFNGNLLYESKVPEELRRQIDAASRAYASFIGRAEQVRREYNNRLTRLMPHLDSGWTFDELNLRVRSNDLHVASILGSMPLTALLSSLNNSQYHFLYCGPSTSAQFEPCPREFLQALERVDDLPAFPTFLNSRMEFKTKLLELKTSLRDLQP